MSEPFIGEIRVLPYNFAPRGWMYCMGQTLQIRDYAPLYAVIGTIYGGDGQSTFKLPNLSGYATIGVGLGTGLTQRVLASTTGANTVTLNSSQVPPHNHTLNTCNMQGTSTDPTNKYIGHYASNFIYKDNPDPATLVAMSANSLLPTGSGQAHENRQPALAVPFCIATDGIFPTRN